MEITYGESLIYQILVNKYFWKDIKMEKYLYLSKFWKAKRKKYN